jgi:hypothetical protein
MDDSLKMNRETIPIEGGRNLYNYTFASEASLDPETHSKSEKRHGESSEADGSRPTMPPP